MTSFDDSGDGELGYRHVRRNSSTASIAGPCRSRGGRGKQQEKYFFHMDRFFGSAFIRAVLGSSPSLATAPAPVSVLLSDAAAASLGATRPAAAAGDLGIVLALLDDMPPRTGGFGSLTPC